MSVDLVDKPAPIKMEPKAAFFVGGEQDGKLEMLSQHPKFIDANISPSPIALPDTLVPALTMERYFLYPGQIISGGVPHSIYVIQGWSMENVAEYLLMLYIQLLHAPDDNEIN